MDHDFTYDTLGPGRALVTEFFHFVEEADDDDDMGLAIRAMVLRHGGPDVIPGLLMAVQTLLQLASRGSGETLAEAWATYCRIAVEVGEQQDGGI